ncbi:MAG: hypothetical protein WC843_02730 [Candidatus Gracilibacteria bacterium]
MIAECKECHKNFELSQKDLDFFERIAPIFNGKKYPLLLKMCPDCRQQRRLSFRNERTFYKRKCDLTNKDIISFYPANSPYKVYESKAWWSDDWDPMQYGQDYDLSKPFFAQFDELLKAVPHFAMMVSDKSENSDFCPYSIAFKNSYMCVSGGYSESCHYCFWTNFSRDCVDCYGCSRCELCYECVECDNLYGSIFCKDSGNSSDLYFCNDCRGCQNCIGCFGLRNKQYHIFNQPVSKSEYEDFLKNLQSGRGELQKMELKTKDFFAPFPHVASQMVNCENCSGDYLRNSKNSDHCYHADGIEDCAYCWNIPAGAKDCQDINYSKGELLYNCMSAVDAFNCFNVIHSWNIHDVYYSFETFYSDHCFGCVGLKHKKFCILNKQYSEEEYNKLVPKIIEQMRKSQHTADGVSAEEWGDFFPSQISPFAYNETIAQDYFPLDKNATLAKGLHWVEPDLKEYQPSKIAIPDQIQTVPDSITQEILACEDCGKNYKIIPQELKFYRKLQLPIPRKCSDCRHKTREGQLNPRRLLERNCHQCKTKIQTTYADERPVYCNSCYLKLIY